MLDRLQHSGCRGISCKRRKIQKHGVFAEQPACWPPRFQHETQIGLANSIQSAELHDCLGPCRLNIELDVAKKGLSIDRKTCEVTLGSQLHADLICAHITKLQQRDIGTQWLIQSGF